MNNSNVISRGIIKAVLVLFGAALVGFLLLSVKSLFIYFAFAYVLTLIGKPLVDLITRRLKQKKVVAVSIVMALYFAFFVGFIFMFVPLFATQAKNLSVLNTNHLQSNFNNLIQQIDLYLTAKGFSLNNIIETAHLEPFKLDFVSNMFNGLLTFLSEFGMALFAVLFITFFTLKDNTLIALQLKTLVPERRWSKAAKSVSTINYLLSRYFIGLLIQTSIIFALSLILLGVVGVNGAIVIAFLCAILNIIPYIGPLIGNISAVVFTMLSFIGDDFMSVTLPKAITVLIGFLAIQLFDNIVNQPLIFSNSIKSHPLEIFIVILACGMFSGIFGMIVAIPIYTCLKVIGKQFFPNIRFIQMLTKNI